MQLIVKILSLLVISSISYAADDAIEITASNVHNIATATNTKSKISVDEHKPKLENYSNYNDFLHAMYLYNKAQEDDIKPRIIVNLPTNPIVQPEYTTIGDNSDVTTRGEDMSALQPLVDDNQ